jgi:ABC-type lipoprotein release transport system permease subunit
MAALSPSVLGAAALAAIVAVASSAFMPFGLAGRAEPDPGMRVDPPVLVIGVAATLLLLGAAVVLAAARAVRADAGAARASRPNLSTRLAHAGMPVPSRFGVHLALGPARAGGRGANRAAIAGVALATAAGVGALVVGASVDHLVSTPAAYGWTWDFTVLDDTARRLADDPEVASASVVTAGSITLDGRPMPVRGIEQVKGDVPVRVVDGRHPGPGEVVLGSRTMDSLDVRIGDTVVARGIEDEQELRIVGEAVLAGVVDIPEAGWGAAMTASDLEAIGPDGEDIFSVGIVSLADGVNRERFAARVEAEQGEPPELAEEPVELSRLHEIEAFPYALFAFLALVGFVAIAHAVVLTARRRGGDLAVLRSMGMARRGVYRAVSVQALVLAVIGGLVGIPLGLLAARALWRDLAESIGVVVEVDVPWPLILGVGVAAIGGLSLFARLPGRRVARARPAAILRAE